MLTPSACPPGHSDQTGQTAGERNEGAGSYTTLRGTIPASTTPRFAAAGLDLDEQQRRRA
jgi:hypothetical protein